MKACTPLICDYLRWKYPQYALLSRCGETYPVVVLQAPGNQVMDPESVLVRPLIGNAPRDDIILPRDIPYRIERLGKSKINRPNFVMRSLRTEGSLAITCQIGRYFDCVETCYALGNEIRREAVALEEKGVRAPQALDQRLTMRKEVHKHVGDPVHDGAMRSPSIGVSTVICYRHDGLLYLWLQKRSATVATDPHLIHVIPSFMFAPVTNAVDEEYSIKHNFRREYLEELFGRAKMTATQLDPKYFYLEGPLVYLDKLLRDERAFFRLTGITFDLLTLRPEVCTLLFIDDAAWYEWHTGRAPEGQRFKLNLEWARTDDANDADGVFVARIRYSRCDEDIMRQAPLTADRLTAPGAGAFWLAVDLIRRICPGG